MKRPANAPLSQSPPENYERFFVPAIGEPMALDLIGAAALKRGERVLDAACGTGVVARLAAHEVGPEGAVTGADINAGMLDVARKSAPPESILEWQHADAEALPFPDETYDVVFCQMGLQFMENKRRAVEEMYRVLKDGGRLLINVPGPLHEVFNILAEGMEHHIDPAAAGFVRRVFSIDRQEELESLLRDAHFRRMQVTSYSRPLMLPAAKDFLWQYVYSTPLVAMVDGAGSDAKQEFENEVVSGWKSFEHDGVMSYDQPVLVAGAVK